MFKKSLLIMLFVALMAPWAVGQKTLPYSYGFENNDLAGEGWTTSGAISGTGITNGTYYGSPHTGTRYFTFKYNSSSTGKQYLISPELTTSSKDILVEFYYRKHTSGNETFKVGYSTTTNATDQFTFGEEIAVSNTTYPEKPNFSQTFPYGTKYIAIYYYVYNQYYLSIDDISIEEASSCAKPTGLNASLTVGNGRVATLRWTENGSAEDWVLQYGTDENFAANTYTEVTTGFVVDGTTIRASLTNLTPEQTYYARVKANCGNNDESSWSGTISFTPSDFVTIGSGTITTNATIPTSTQYKYSISQQIYTASELGAEGTISKISFYSASSITRSFKIYMAHTTTSSYSGLTGISVATSDLVFDGSVTFAAGAWANITLDRGFDYDGEKNLVVTIYDCTGVDEGYSGVSFNAYSIDYQYRSLYSRTDDGAYDPTSYSSYSSRSYYRNQIRLVIAPAVACETVPTGLSVSSVDHESAVLSWNEVEGTTWLVQYKANDSEEWINAYEGTANTYTLTGLTELTTYNAQIKAKCNTEAGYVAFDNFTTEAIPCINPSDFAASDITVEGATLSWTGGTAPYIVEYKTTAASSWTTVEGTVSGTSYELTGLVSNETYTARVKASCQGETDNWVILASNFTTLDCSTPTGLSVTQVIYNSFTLTWTAGNSIAWDVQYKVKDAAVWTDFGTVTSSTCTLAGLEETTEYQARVKATCSTDGWESFTNFTTTSLPATDVDLTHPFNVDFTNISELPSEWASTTWTVEAPSGGDKGYVHSTYSSTNDLISPVVRITGAAKIKIKQNASGSGYGSYTCTILATTDGGVTFEESTISASPTTSAATTNTYSIPSTWINKKVQLVFRRESTINGKRWNIHTVDISVGTIFQTEGTWTTSSNWSAGVPDANTDVLINANVNTSYGAAVANNITISDGVTLTINNNTTLTCNNITNNGNLVIENGGQLICNNDVVVTMQKSIEASTPDDPETPEVNEAVNKWYLISSPVDGPTVASIAKGTYNMYYYDEQSAFWMNDKVGEDPENLTIQFEELTNGRGYLYRSTEPNVTFTGNANVGTVDYTLTYHDENDKIAGFHLIGNPYTHEIYKGENGAIESEYLEGGFYTLSVAGAWIPGTDNSTAIAPGQAILVQATEVVGDNDQTLTITNKTTGGSAKYGNDYIMFRVENSEYSDKSYVLFKKGHGLNKIDHRNAEIPMLYVINNGEEFAIADMPDNTSVINLGFEAKTMGQYTISLKAEGQYSYMHLYDKLTGEDIDMLVEDSYTFIGSQNDRKDRFVLNLNYNAAGIDSESDIFAYQNGSDIIVNGEGELQVIDITGRKVMTTTVNGVEIIRGLNSGVYIFRVIGETQRTQKIVVR